jgi:hypothetical protein
MMMTMIDAYDDEEEDGSDVEREKILFNIYVM